MQKRPAFDCETDGFLDTHTKFHYLAIIDLESGEKLEFADQPGPPADYRGPASSRRGGLVGRPQHHRIQPSGHPEAVLDGVHEGADPGPGPADLAPIFYEDAEIFVTESALSK